MVRLTVEPDHATASRPESAARSCGQGGAPSTSRSLECVGLEQLDERYAELRMSRPGIVAAVRRSIDRDGLLRPLLVNLERDGKLAVLDGLKRLRALRDLGQPQAQVRVMQLDEAAARAAMMAHNAPHRGLCELEQAWVVRSLVRGCGLQQRQVAELLGHHKSWVCRRLALAERLDETVQQDIRLGLVSTTMARELSKLPRGNQSPVALTARQHGLSCRQSAVLVEQALSCRDDKALTALLRDPWRQLVKEPLGGAARDLRLGQSAEVVRQRLLALERAARWLHESLLEQPLSSLATEEIEVLVELTGHARQRCQQTVERLDAFVLLRPSVRP